MKKKAIYHNLVGSLSSFGFTIISGVILIPYYFQYIDKESYGIWLGGLSLLSLFTVIDGNLAMVLTKLLSNERVKNNTKNFSDLFFAGLFLGLILFAVIGSAVFLFKDKLAMSVQAQGPAIQFYAKCFLLYSIGLTFNIISSFINALNQSLLRTLLPPFFGIVSAIAGIAYTVITVPTRGVAAIAEGFLIKGGIYLMCNVIYGIYNLNSEKIKFNFHFKAVAELVSNVKWPFFSKLAMTAAVNLQNFIISAFLIASLTTVYDVTRKLPIMIGLIVNIITVSTFTSFGMLYSENNTKQDFYSDAYFTLIKLLMAVPLFGIFLFGKEVIGIWVGLDKFGGLTLLGLLCVVQFLDQLRLTLSQQYYAKGLFRLTSITDIIYGVFFLLSLVFLLKPLGLIGVALSSLVAAFIYYLSCLYFERKEGINFLQYIFNRQLIAVAFIGTMLALTLYFCFLTFDPNPFIAIVIKALVLIFFIVLVLVNNKKTMFFVYKQIRRN